MTRGTDTEVRAYEGEVESLTSADSSGVGIRVLVDGPAAPAARSASPGPDRSTRRHRRHPGRCPRQRPLRHAGPRRGPGRARRRGGRGARPVGRRRRRRPPWRRRWRWRSSWSGRRAAPTRGSGRSPRPTTRTAGWRWRWPRRPGSRRSGGAPTPSCRSTPSPGRARRPRPAPGSASAAGPASCVPDEAMDDAVLRATRMLGAQKVPSAHCTVVFDPRVVSTLLAVVASALSGRGRREGPLLLRRAHRRDRRRRRAHPGRRPDRRPRLRRDRRTTAKGWPAGATS